ncbi:hypothetical protein [Geomonas azotofigens]|uniref:hypothetical protein n=1 Tax=Geomonas azotofigens TaxID=2843196 RepID=UPI001C10E0B7|nr:hypothetical protein [Geomonas azotofigens]MBU5612828.1 hypothetical protein [Geomonas azotofigens]
MAQPNFKFQKRQKELDRIKKQQEKALRKQEKSDQPLADEADGQDAQSGEIEP